MTIQYLCPECRQLVLCQIKNIFAIIGKIYITLQCRNCRAEFEVEKEAIFPPN